jgi:sortase A
MTLQLSGHSQLKDSRLNAHHEIQVARSVYEEHVNSPKSLRRTLGTLSLLIGSLLLAIYLVPNVYGSAMAHLAVARFRAQSSSNRLWDSARIRAYRSSLAVKFPPPEAILRVPKVNIEVPVLEGTDDLTLNRGAGHLPGTPLPGQPGNIAITGHRDGFFRGLKDLVPGDAIEVDRPGHTDRYLVRSIRIVSPSDTSVLAPTTDATLTLITCYPFYFVGAAPQRYIVQASLAIPAQAPSQTASSRAIHTSGD